VLKAVINDYIGKELVQHSSRLPLGGAPSLLEPGTLGSRGVTSQVGSRG
jgi:hypothetical protein